MSQSISQMFDALILKYSVDIKKYLKRMKIYSWCFFKEQSGYDDFCRDLKRCGQPIHKKKLQLIFDKLGDENFINLLLICDYIEDALQFAPVLMQDISVISKISRNINNWNLLELDYTIVPKFGIRDHNNEIRKDIAPTDAHKLEGNNRGHFYIVVNIPTIGTLKQMRDWAEIFNALKFEVKFRINLNASQIIDDFKEMLPLEGRTDNHYAFIFYYLGHGSVNTIDGFNDKLNRGNYLRRSEIENLIIKSELYSKERPVTLIYDCCRINDIRFTINTTQSCFGILPILLRRAYRGLSNAIDSPPLLKDQPPKYQNVLTCYTAQEGYSAYVKFMEGTSFGTNAAKMLKDHAIHKTFEYIFNKTSEAMKKDKKDEIIDDYKKNNNNCPPTQQWVNDEYAKLQDPIVLDNKPLGKTLYLGINIKWDNNNSDFTEHHYMSPV